MNEIKRPFIKSHYKVSDPKSAMEDKHGKIGEAIEFHFYGPRLIFAGGQRRNYFWHEVTLVEQPFVALIPVGI